MTWMKNDLFVTIRQQERTTYVRIYICLPQEQDIYPYGRDVFEIEIQNTKICKAQMQK